MIAQAHKTGDVLRNPVRLKEMSFDQRNFWTAHFGGLYVFQDVPHPAVIVSAGKAGLDDLPLGCHTAQRDRAIPAAQRAGRDGAGGARNSPGGDPAPKDGFITIGAVAKEGTKLNGLTHASLRRRADILPPEFHKLGALVNWA